MRERPLTHNYQYINGDRFNDNIADSIQSFFCSTPYVSHDAFFEGNIDACGGVE